MCHMLESFMWLSQATGRRSHPDFVSQSAGSETAAPTWPRKLLEIQNLRPSLELLNLNLHFQEIPGDLYSHLSLKGGSGSSQRPKDLGCPPRPMNECSVIRSPNICSPPTLPSTGLDPEDKLEKGPYMAHASRRLLF